MAEAAREIKGETAQAGPGFEAVPSGPAGVAEDLRAAALDQGRRLLDDAKRQATSYADDRKNEAARSVSDIAASLRETGRSFEDRPNIRAFVGNAADGLDQLAEGLRERSFAELYGEAEAYARRSPVVVGAVAVVAGFLLARFIKSSADELSESSAAARAEIREAKSRETRTNG